MIIRMFKKFFLSLFITIIWFVGFSSANSFTVSSNTYLKTSDCVWTPTISSVGWDLICPFSNQCYSSIQCLGYMFSFPNWGWTTNNVSFKVWDYNITCSSYPCSVTLLDWSYFEFQAPPPPLLPGGEEALSGAVTNLTNSVNEFIPYIVYIWLWILIACIWFVAIKRLINWLRAKIFSSFK